MGGLGVGGAGRLHGRGHPGRAGGLGVSPNSPAAVGPTGTGQLAWGRPDRRSLHTSGRSGDRLDQFAGLLVHHDDGGSLRAVEGEPHGRFSTHDNHDGALTFWSAEGEDPPVLDFAVQFHRVPLSRPAGQAVCAAVGVID